MQQIHREIGVAFNAGAVGRAHADGRTAIGIEIERGWWTTQAQHGGGIGKDRQCEIPAGTEPGAPPIQEILRAI
ncbi:hypothetical protein D3C72_1836590 [compost metagenome]